MSFNRLLKDASAEAKADYSPLRRRGEDKGCDDAKGEAKALDATAMAELVNLVSEYLFDLFDANLMEEFKALERFEIDCMDHFDPEAEESEPARGFRRIAPSRVARRYTFKQEALHREANELRDELRASYNQRRAMVKNT